MTRFVLYIGPMFSGKTTSLLAELDRYKFKNKKILLVKPTSDQRYSNSEVCTHSGQAREGMNVNYLDDIMKLEPYSYDVVAIDEAFMIPEVDKLALSLYASGITVLISSLDLSSSLQPFPEVTRMMSYATEVHKCASICGLKGCYEDAYLTHKLEGVGKKASGEIEVGGAEMYEPRCHSHHPLLTSFK